MGNNRRKLYKSKRVNKTKRRMGNGKYQSFAIKYANCNVTANREEKVEASTPKKKKKIN